ncbi:MAG: 1-acyl-sn-glycerol-3-phosphate acyltransferase [Myxococcales bacterium]|nr:1-acyl-sn-glycerol-3-phosphate acyltransferase [Myxococcales bacterium]
MSTVRAAYRSGAFVSLSAGILAAYEMNRLFVPKELHEPLADTYRTYLVNRLLEVFGAQIAINGEFAHKSGALIVANHQSALDIAVMLSVFRGVMVSRHDVADWPLLGRMAKHGATIFVDRQDGHSGAVAVRAMRRRLREGRTVVAFPEGGTFPEDTVHDFQPGAFAAVRSLNVPIVPVGLTYSPAVPYGHESFARHLGRIAARPRTRVSVRVGEPMLASLDPRAAAAAARARVQELVIDGREELDAG